MIEKTCRCGKTKKNFKVDIGPFFVDECCLEAGYDEVGNLKKKPLDTSTLPTQEEIDAEAAKLQDDTSPEPEDNTEKIQAEIEAKEKAKAEKEAEKARKKAEKEAAKAAKKAEKEQANKA